MKLSPLQQCLSLLHSKNPHPLPPTTTTQLHALLLTSGHLHHPRLLPTLYSAAGHLSHDGYLLDQMPHPPPLHLSNSLLRSYTHLARHQDALLLYSRMPTSDHLTFPFAIKACAGLRLGRLCRAVHCRALAAGFSSDAYVQNALIAMYMSCGNTAAAEAVFGAMHNQNVVSWNTVIAGCVKNGRSDKALEVFDRMLCDGVGIDRATVVSVLPACVHAKDFRTGSIVHRLVEERGLGDYVAVRNGLIDMYGKCGRLEEARRVFDDGTYEKDVVSWTAMIGACVLNGSAGEALVLGCQMQMIGVRPNAVTMTSLLSACAALPSVQHAKCGHALCIRLGLEPDIVVETALINTYAKCDRVDLMELAFQKGSRRTETWNAAILCYARNEHEEKAIGQFKRMLAESVRLDLATMASVLPAYAEAADLQQAKNIHCCLLRLGFLRSAEVTTSLIDAYAKAGDLDAAWVLFHCLPAQDLIAWSTIIAGYGMHGHARIAILLYDRMVESGVKPNTVTFASLLYSCSHAGMVDEGLRLFKDMLNVHGLTPNAEHYSCLVDMLGRAGQIEEAYWLIKDMPFKPNCSVWGALLGACVLHENVEFGEVAAEHLFELDPENTGNYVLLGNIYAAAERWVDVQSVRRMMVARGLSKKPGSSLLEARSV